MGDRMLAVFVILVLEGAVIAVLLAYLVARRGATRKTWDWSIGIYSGDSPFRLHPDPRALNPVITAADVTDVSANYIADPFMIRVDGHWFLFFEVLNAETDQGDIGLATSDDGLHWKYQQIVLHEPYHLSYPYVFKWDNEIYMVPESAGADHIRLYRAEAFPAVWVPVTDLLAGSYADSSIIRFEGTWYLFTCSEPVRHNVLKLFWADDLLGPWHEHPKSPIVGDNASMARPGGRLVSVNGRPVRFAQDDESRYGYRVLAFAIMTLTKSAYDEEPVEENPILEAAGLLAPGRKWNRHGMHHLDPHEIANGEWLAVVDGYRKHLSIAVEY